MNSCPECGSDDYICEWLPDNSGPDYENGFKRYEEWG